MARHAIIEIVIFTKRIYSKSDLGIKDLSLLARDVIFHHVYLSLYRQSVFFVY